MRKLLLFVCLVLLSGQRQALAEEVGDSLNAEMDAYQDSLKGRLVPEFDVGAHFGTTIGALALLDGRVLINQSWGSLSWSAKRTAFQLWQGKQSVSLHNGVDEYGRPTFSTEGVQGAIDVVRGQIYIQIISTQGQSYWTGSTNMANTSCGGLPSNQGQDTCMNETKCVCKGSNNECSGGDEDCRNDQSCTLPGGNSSKCGRYKVPLAR